MLFPPGQLQDLFMLILSFLPTRLDMTDRILPIPEPTTVIRHGRSIVIIMEWCSLPGT